MVRYLEGKISVGTNDLSPSPPTTQLWQMLYQDAVLEFDNTKLAKRILQARSAIQDRAEEIPPDSSERERLDSALDTLQILEEIAARKESA